ncbi:MAG: hypothetical protein HYR67_08160 [Bacteroidetes bacterium]|nr:hypothetical protein [Bacteroidota bacterium]
MRQPQITQDHIDQILNEKLPLMHWELQLGIGVVYENAPLNVKYKKPYLEYGQNLWKAFEYDLFNIICNKDSNSPKEWITDLVTGDIRNAIIGVAAVITSKYDVSMGIAIPVTALIIKTGILKYCSGTPKKPKKTVNEILDKLLNRKVGKKGKKKRKNSQT